jgi:thiamine biosynthesis lipoprotein
MLIAAGAGGAAALGGAILGGDQPLEQVTRRTHALGTEVSISVRHSSSEAAHEAIDAAFAELELVESLMSIYRPHSQVSVLNRTGRIDNPHPYLIEVLRHATVMSHRTSGAFDITVQPLWQVFVAAAKENRVPGAEEVAAARRQVDWTNLDTQPGYIRLRQPSTAITLNGIAQGFAADRVQAVLQRHGIEHALINAGEHVPLGISDDGDPWTVGIQHPREPDAFVGMTDLVGRCLATSGDYETKFSPDSRHHHIFDPRSGYSPTELASVSVLAPSAMQADAFSTALFVLEPEKGMELITRTPNTDAFFVLKDGSTIVTAGFPLVTDGRPA